MLANYRKYFNFVMSNKKKSNQNSFKESKDNKSTN